MLWLGNLIVFRSNLEVVRQSLQPGWDFPQESRVRVFDRPAEQGKSKYREVKRMSAKATERFAVALRFMNGRHRT